MRLEACSLLRKGLGSSLLAVLVLGAACGTEADTTFVWTGTWDGTATMTGVVPGNPTPVTESGFAQLVLTQSGAQVSGTWSSLSPSGQFNGAVAGRVTDTGITMTISTLSPFPCALSGQGTRSGQVVTGSLTPQTCAISLSGNFSFTKK
jgi:hypothetical protein